MADAKAEQGVMLGLADPGKTTRWWVRCDRKAALQEVKTIVDFHRAWFAEHGLKAEYGTVEGDAFTPSETLDTSSIRV